MKILKRFVDEEVWNETTQAECLNHTEGSGYWKENSVLSLLEEGQVVHTPFARYKAAEHQRQRMVCTACETELSASNVYCPTCGLWNPNNRR